MALRLFNKAEAIEHLERYGVNLVDETDEGTLVFNGAKSEDPLVVNIPDPCPEYVLNDVLVRFFGKLTDLECFETHSYKIS